MNATTPAQRLAQLRQDLEGFRDDSNSSDSDDRAKARNRMAYTQKAIDALLLEHPELVPKTKEQVAAKAQAIWDAMNDNERQGVAFGMFPNAKMATIKEEGFNERDQQAIVVLLMKM